MTEPKPTPAAGAMIELVAIATAFAARAIATKKIAKTNPLTPVDQNILTDVRLPGQFSAKMNKLAVVTVIGKGRQRHRRFRSLIHLQVTVGIHVR